MKTALLKFKKKAVTQNYLQTHAPSLAVATGNILIQDTAGLALLDPSGKLLARLDTQRFWPIGAAVSPAGNMIVAVMRTNTPDGRLVIFTKENPDVRHVLHHDVFYRIDWTTGGKDISNQRMQVTQ